MILSFADPATEDVFNGRSTKPARKLLPAVLHAVARRKLDALNVAQRITDLRVPPGNHLEALKGDRAGQHSIRINDQFRICFTWTSAGPQHVQVVDYH